MIGEAQGQKNDAIENRSMYGKRQAIPTAGFFVQDTQTNPENSCAQVDLHALQSVLIGRGKNSPRLGTRHANAQ
jgi:hypothetical protein